MRELILRARAADVEELLEALLPALPGDVHVEQGEGEEARLTVSIAPGTPDVDELLELAGPLAHSSESREAPDDWRERRLARYEPLVVADRFLVRPEWAPSGEGGLIEIALAEIAAFGTGTHPTTRACMAALAEASAAGSLADYGCGSGVLAIAAAKLGFSPVIAVDVDPLSVEAADENARRNEAAVETRRLDLTVEPPPPAETIVANVPPEVHLSLVESIAVVPAVAILSGFHAEKLEEVAGAWTALGLEVTGEERIMEWSLLVMR
jgi:ribosomal protein L11 methyltransferase